jgi:hypothetical protein
MTKVNTKSKKLQKKKTTKTLLNEGEARITKTFRFKQSDIKKLLRIASVKKATSTKVISELIRIAYAGLFMPEMKALDKFYKDILQLKQMELQPEDIKKIKRKVVK